MTRDVSVLASEVLLGGVAVVHRLDDFGSDSRRAGHDSDEADGFVDAEAGEQTRRHQVRSEVPSQSDPHSVADFQALGDFWVAVKIGERFVQGVFAGGEGDEGVAEQRPPEDAVEVGDACAVEQNATRRPGVPLDVVQIFEFFAVGEVVFEDVIDQRRHTRLDIRLGVARVFHHYPPAKKQTHLRQ